MKIDGRCHCGYVSFEAEADPETTTLCNCTDCQTMSGAPLRAIIGTQPGTFVLLSGAPTEYRKTADSGNIRQQGFCPRCGTAIYSAPDGDDPKAYNVRVGVVRQRYELVPRKQVFVRSRQAWSTASTRSRSSTKWRRPRDDPAYKGILTGVSPCGTYAKCRIGPACKRHIPGETPMNRSRIVSTSAAAALGMSLLTGGASGQSLKEQLLGTWTLVSHESVSMYGANPKGVAFFDADGHFIITVMSSDRAKYANSHPAHGTADENKATAQGTMTYFGTYSVSEAHHTIAIHIEASSFPNWNAADQERIVAIAGDQLTLTARALGGSADVVWKRAK